MERYSNLFRLPDKLYTQGSPLLVAAGALLKDNQTGHILAQLKFRNLSNKGIKAVKVRIRAFDVVGAEIQGISEYQYLDLSAPRNAEFGQKTAIPLPNPITRSFSVVCTTVIFLDNTLWEPEEHAVWAPLPQQKELQNRLGNLTRHYQDSTSFLSRFEPLEYSDLWLCSCGQINNHTERTCFHCRLTKEKIFSAFDLKELNKKHNLFLLEEQKRKEEAEKWQAAQREEAQKRARKRKKTLCVLGICLLLLVGITALTTNFIIPLSQYNSALSMMEAGEYDSAIEAFEKLGDFQDSSEQVKEATYRKASDLLEQDLFSAAEPIFASIEDYKDAKEKLVISQKEPDYRKALSYMEKEENLDSAYHIFVKLGDYKDSEDYLAKFSVVLSFIDIDYSYYYDDNLIQETSCSLPVQFAYSDTGKMLSMTIGKENGARKTYTFSDEFTPESISYKKYYNDKLSTTNDTITFYPNRENPTEIRQQQNYKYSNGVNTVEIIYELNDKQQVDSYQREMERTLDKNGYTYQNHDEGSITYSYDDDVITQMTIERESEKDVISFHYDYLYNENKMSITDIPCLSFYFTEHLYE